jgi:hypothetical protein
VHWPPTVCSHHGRAGFGADAMRQLVPDQRLRSALEAEMPRLPVSYFDASIPLPEAWERRPCGYLPWPPIHTGKAPSRPGPAAGRRRDPRYPASGNRDQPDPGHRRSAQPRARPQGLAPVVLAQGANLCLNPRLSSLISPNGPRQICACQLDLRRKRHSPRRSSRARGCWFEPSRAHFTSGDAGREPLLTNHRIA